jgi:hypothetical protein
MSSGVQKVATKLPVYKDLAQACRWVPSLVKLAPLISIENASDIRLTGLTLEGEAKPIDSGALLIAESVKGLTLSDCRVIGSAEHGIVLHGGVRPH